MAKVLDCSPVYLLCLDENNPSSLKTSIVDVTNLEKKIIDSYRAADNIDIPAT